MINLETTWDISANIKMTDTNSNLINKKLTGRFDPATATETNILDLISEIIDLTTNTYEGTFLTAKSPNLFYPDN